jgi:tryptophanyl-tRNA synthetase
MEGAKTFPYVPAMALVDKRILSGIQPSGTKHLGNYFGAMVQHLELQHAFPGECYIFIADYHALTTVNDADTMRQSVFDLAATYLALGLDPDKALLFRQSDVPQVTELAWLLATVTGMGLLERATSYKDKVEKGIKPSVGLFTYPVLMASDILIYQATTVPVGKDQIQHIEMAQDMATHFNQTYGVDILRRPEARMSKTPYVPGTDGQKMSTSYGNTLPLFETGKKLKKLLGKIVTDSRSLGEPLDPSSCNVFRLIQLFADEVEIADLEGCYKAGKRNGEPFGYGHAKQILQAHIEQRFAPAREKLAQYHAEPQLVEDVLQRCATRARATAQETMDGCKRACGLT